jgi:hypothetical protein
LERVVQDCGSGRGEGDGVSNEIVFTLEELKRLCEEYDKAMGNYPEHEYEGDAVYSWIEWFVDKKAGEPTG